MNRIWTISDTHLEHPAIPKFRDLVTSVDDNTEQIVHHWRALVEPDDTVVCVGDMAWNIKGLRILQALPGRKVLVPGNHDFQTDVTVEELAKTYVKFIDALKNFPGGFWFQHAPMHPQELRGKTNIHGHMHREAIQDARYVNVNVDFTGMKPVLLDDIKSGKYTTYDKVPYEAERHR